MGARRWSLWTVALLFLGSGCMTEPLLDNPVRVQPTTEEKAECDSCTQVYIPLGPDAYGLVFEHVLDVVDDYFAICYANRYDGRIETHPMVAPGLGQPWKRGSPDFPQRLLATLQSMRHRGIVLIRPAENDGFFVEVKVYKELEDLPRPSQAIAGAASFRSDNTVQRRFEVVDAVGAGKGWIAVGRDHKMEQAILERIRCYDPKSAGHPNKN